MRKCFATLRSFGLMFFAMLLVNAAIAQNATIKGSIKDAAEPLQGASVVAEGKGGTYANAAGNFELKLPAGSYKITVSFVGYQSQTFNVTLTAGQVYPLSVELKRNTDIQQVTVVGTRSTAIRTSTQTAAPRDVFSARELQMTGQIEPTQMVNFVAPSFNSSRQTIADGTDHIDPATLRGLGPDQVLVLVNGQRRHNTALLNVNGTIGRGSVGTDLNSIPASAIERIEVLRDGAASQYGSDAIAGVINVVLKKDVRRTNLNIHRGGYYAGDGNAWGLGLNHGMRLGKKGGFLDVFADIRDREATNRSGDYTGGVYYNYAGLSGDALANVKAQDEAIIKQRGFSRKNNMTIGNSAVENYGFMFNAGLPLSERVNLNLFGGLNYREGSAGGFYRYPYQTSQVIAARYPDGFLPQILSTIRDNSIGGSVEGTTKSNWRWSFNGVYGRNNFHFDVANSNNASQYAMGANAQTEFDAGILRFGQATGSFNISKDFGKSIGVKTFNLAFGNETRIENYEIEAGEEASYKNYDPQSGRVGGAQVFPGFQPVNAVNETRYINGTYVDLETDINDNFLINAAARYEDYSDFGGNIAGKLSMRYKIIDALTIRGTVSNGFRAPSMHQRYFSAVSTVFVNTSSGLVPLQQGTFRNNSQIAGAFGIPSLDAEKSMNYSVGITSKIKGINLTVDAYQINIDDRIVLTGSFTKSNSLVNSILSAYPDINSAIFFTNAINTRTRGIDVVANKNLKLGVGSLDVTIAANVNKTEVVGDIKTSPVLAADPTLANGVLFNMEERGRIERGQPRLKGSLNVNYRVSKVTVNFRATRFGKVATIFNGSDRSRDEYFSPKVVTDASITLHATHFLNITIGANNIGDVYPDRMKNFANTGDGRFIYSRNSTQFGFNGGYWFTNIGIDLTNLRNKAKAAPVQ